MTNPPQVANLPQPPPREYVEFLLQGIRNGADSLGDMSELSMFEIRRTPNGRSTRSLLLSLAIHTAAVAAIFAVRFSVNAVREQAEVRLFAPAPVPVVKKHAAIRPPKLPSLPLAAKAPALRFTAPSIAPKPLPVMQTAPLPQMPTVLLPGESQAAVKIIEPIPIEIKPAAPPVVLQTGVFANAAATVAKGASASPVEVGGFSSASVGSARGGRSAQISASGFGDTGLASASGGSRGAVRSSGFADAVAAPAPAVPGQVRSVQAATPAQILDKPRPVYTEEARRLQIEGEVQLEVLFGASGQIRILRLVRGLGHGLDENAEQAAKSIHFLPAKRDGQAVDSTALVHIIFQLAS